MDRSLAFVQGPWCLNSIVVMFLTSYIAQVGTSLYSGKSIAFVNDIGIETIYLAPPRPDQTLATSSSPSVAESFSHNPFTPTPHPQPPLHPSQRSDSSSTSSLHNPFLHRNLSVRSDTGNTKLPPLPPRKQLAPPIPPPMPTVPSKNIISSHNRLDRSRSPSKLPNHALPAHPPTIPPKPIQHITSTLIKQSLQATKAAQTMKKAEEQLERERVMQVLKSSSTVSGAYPLAGASVTNSSVVVGTHVYNQHQYHRRSPSPMGQGQGATGGGFNKKLGYPASSTSSSSDERAPPLPMRRTQQQPSPPLSASSFEQVALATTHLHPVPPPPSSTATAFSNPESSSNAHVHPYPHPTSPFHSRSRVDSTVAIPYSSSPEQSPRRTSVDLPSSGTTRGRPPPTHPDRKPHHLQNLYHPNPNAHGRSQSYSYSDPFAGASLDSKNPEEPATNANEAFEKIYGPSTSSSTNPFPPSTTVNITPSTPSPNRAFRSKSLHQLDPPAPPVPRPSLGRKRPESVQVAQMSDVGVEVDRNETMRCLSSPIRKNNTSTNGLHASLTTSALAANSNKSNSNRCSSLSVSSMPSSSSSPPSHRQTPFGVSSSPSSLTLASLAGPPPHPHPHPASSSASSTTTMAKQDHLNPAPNPLASLQKTLLQIQPHLDKARYKAEAGLSKRGFVRDGLRRGKSSGSVGVDVDGDEEEIGSEDGLERLVNNGIDGGGGKKQLAMGRWRVNSDGGGLDGEVDQDSDWTRSEGMSMSHGRSRAHRHDSDGDEDSLEKDNLKWPAGEGWKPL